MRGEQLERLIRLAANNNGHRRILEFLRILAASG